MKRTVLAAFSAMLLAGAPALAYEINDRLTVGGVAAFSGQCDEDGCEGALPVQPELSFRPGEADEIFVKFGFAAGNGLNATSRFNVPPWAADLEGDVEDIHGRRSHLLTAWYKRTVAFRGGSSLGLTVGIIDATDYLDDNAYSNDEYTQFMNSALVNGPNVFLPSYDRGFALEWEGSRWSARGVYMLVGENDDGREFHFYGAQVGYRADTPLGEGNYRLLVDVASEDFLDPTGSRLEGRGAVLLSCDQQFGEVVGAFLRIGRQADDAAIDYEAIYSGGLDIGGRAWGREDDGIGIGYAHLTGGNGDIERSRVAEGYYRYGANGFLSVTGNVQYMEDDLRGETGPSGWIAGIRLTARF